MPPIGVAECSGSPVTLPSQTSVSQTLRDTEQSISFVFVFLLRELNLDRKWEIMGCPGNSVQLAWDFYIHFNCYSTSTSLAADCHSSRLASTAWLGLTLIQPGLNELPFAGRDLGPLWCRNSSGANCPPFSYHSQIVLFGPCQPAWLQRPLSTALPMVLSSGSAPISNCNLPVLSGVPPQSPQLCTLTSPPGCDKLSSLETLRSVLSRCPLLDLSCASPSRISSLFLDAPEPQPRVNPPPLDWGAPRGP
ncbi:hypothetical protein AB205_0022840 [Aquarana catesbeiana]|uniref:Uncharacterized protein n=1 Tax=Aquarana catesbeiana TaxID=8400 RepID=A0A2G9RRF4_AQUCT|nr:hypothetical protein AB205_0022840 [Aquarana catesbeiana]